MPLEMQILERAAPRRTSISDFYNHRAPRSEVDQRIDAKRSYSHMFNRGQKRSLRGVDTAQQDEAMAKKVDEIVHRYLDGDGPRRHLRPEADEHMFSERVFHVAQRFLGKEQEQEEEPMDIVGAVRHEHKEEDPFDKEFTSEVQDIVDRYSDRYTETGAK